MVKPSRTSFGFLGLSAFVVFGFAAFCFVGFACFTGLVFAAALDVAFFASLPWVDLLTVFFAAALFLAPDDFLAAPFLAAGDFLAAPFLAAGDFFVAGLSATWGSSAAAVGVAVLIISHLLQDIQPCDLRRENNINYLV
ncbi:MAG: hypothetical protein ACK5D0_12250 [Burkholderiaceae bacterium]